MMSHSNAHFNIKIANINTKIMLAYFLISEMEFDFFVLTTSFEVDFSFYASIEKNFSEVF